MGPSILEAITGTVEVCDIGDKGIIGDLTKTGKVVVDGPLGSESLAEDDEEGDEEEGNDDEVVGRSSVLLTLAKTEGETLDDVRKAVINCSQPCSRDLTLVVGRSGKHLRTVEIDLPLLQLGILALLLGTITAFTLSL